MKASEVNDKMFYAFGGKHKLDIRFTKPKKVLVQKDGFGGDEVIEGVTAITVMNFENGLCSIDLNYTSVKGNECSSSTGIQYYKEIQVLD